MVYSSLLYIYGFLPVSLLLFYLTPVKKREMTLLILSIVFSGMISLYYLIFILLFTAVNFGFAYIMRRIKDRKKQAAALLAVGIGFNIFALAAFRTELASWLFGFIGAPKEFYPVGISFFVPCSIGTLIDIYKGRMKDRLSFGRYALYIMFFPKLLMGPLLRYGYFSKLVDTPKVSLSGIGTGMTIFVKGLAKKVIAADNLYMLYTAVKESNVSEISAATAWLGITAYILCLYFTLSGLADMGMGTAYCFGIRLPQSFNYPLLSSRIKYFAARWQSQVEQWIRRYITKPLYHVCPKKWMKDIVIITGWTLFGFWYSFNFCGAVSGFLMGIFIVIEMRLREKKIMEFTGIFYTFIVVLLCSVFLSGDSAAYSMKYLLAMIGGNGALADSQAFYLLKTYIVLILLAMYASTDLFRNMMMRSGKKKIKNFVTVVSPLIVLSVLVICTVLISYSGSSEMLIMKL